MIDDDYDDDYIKRIVVVRHYKFYKNEASSQSSSWLLQNWFRGKLLEPVLKQSYSSWKLNFF